MIRIRFSIIGRILAALAVLIIVLLYVTRP
jgi:hypothetical protein